MLVLSDVLCFVFFKQKTAYEMRISDWSSDVCSSDLGEMVTDGCRATEPSQTGRTAPVYIGVFADPGARHAERFLPVQPRGLRDLGPAHPGDQLPLRDEIGRASCRERVCQYV